MTSCDSSAVDKMNPSTEASSEQVVGYSRIVFSNQKRKCGSEVTRRPFGPMSGSSTSTVSETAGSTMFVVRSRSQTPETPSDWYSAHIGPWKPSMLTSDPQSATARTAAAASDATPATRCTVRTAHATDKPISAVSAGQA